MIIARETHQCRPKPYMAVGVAGGDTRAETVYSTAVVPPPRASAQRRLWQWRGWRRWWRLARGCSAGEGFQSDFEHFFGPFLKS